MTNSNDKAYPSPAGNGGFTKREEIAARNMAQMFTQFGATANDVDFYREHARQAVMAADALLAELKEGTP